MDASLDLLTGDAAAELLGAAVAASGGELVDWRVRQVDHRPGAATTVAYRATVRRNGATRSETLGASVGRTRDGGGPGVVTLSDGDTTVAVWRFPDDPGLPALPRAFDREGVEELLADLGVDPDGRAAPELAVRAYRPTRRAVIEARSASARMFLKVLRPRRVEGLHRRHALLSDAGLPVPRPLGWSDDGLLVLSPLHGTEMRAAVRDGKAVPSPQDLLDLLDRLPADVCDLPRRPAWSESARHYAAMIGAALPAEAGRAADLAGAIRERLAERGTGTDPTHGDLYEAQIMLTGDRVTGLLDVDSAGPGHRADDLACLVAHLDVLSLGGGTDPGRAARGARMRRLAADYAAGFVAAPGGRGVDARDLSTRVAGVLLSLATGPHRVQEREWQAATSRRLDAVAGWLDGTRCPLPGAGAA
ncbi:phosphotransferase [Myceligenerans pegani]|uniref:Phosphotransferase n=1 Tax=Myceligenerans pegani TaxID=2776917 RepID=A0ABR9MZ68_9MICO|nr:phosphotransferase [Myceligenerans sp. TRM 65318]MBE1876677.1 phosphotransferase [Myceligenerans sp. TRM 65318]MBE3018948.1 phosphotransferase [Myceligenerans sp. TRM 65318]